MSRDHQYTYTAGSRQAPMTGVSLAAFAAHLDLTS
jgi:hypothetical protein